MFRTNIATVIAVTPCLIAHGDAPSSILGTWHLDIVQTMKEHVELLRTSGLGRGRLVLELRQAVANTSAGGAR